LLVIVLYCAIGAVVMAIARLFNSRRLTERFPLLFHSAVCRVFSLDVQRCGEITSDRPVLFVSNHVSYMDIFVLGSVLPGAFVAKSEVASWPVFGALGKLQNTLFLERKAQRAADQIGLVAEHLKEQGHLIMFPEGTSTSGDHVKKFRSSLFAAAEGVTVQPVTVAYLDYEGQPMTQAQRERFAWYLPDPSVPKPNRPFAAHFFSGLGLGRCRIQIQVHEPIVMGADFDRKVCAARCEDVVRAGLEALLPEAVDAKSVDGQATKEEAHVAPNFPTTA